MSPTPPALPAGTALGRSYEKGIDIQMPDTSWQTIRRISNLLTPRTPVMQTAQTYDDFGAPNADVTSESYQVTFSVIVNRLTSGLYLPEIEALKAATEPNAIGAGAVVNVRWYDKPYAGTPNPNDAYQGSCTVAVADGAAGPDGATKVWNVTLTGKGKRTQITNPFTGWAAGVPVVQGATPSGAAAGALVTITGAGFTGATAVKFAAVNATVFQVMGDATIVAVMPAGSAGAAAVTVTTPGGTSAAFTYTRG